MFVLPLVAPLRAYVPFRADGEQMPMSADDHLHHRTKPVKWSSYQIDDGLALRGAQLVGDDLYLLLQHGDGPLAGETRHLQQAHLVAQSDLMLVLVFVGAAFDLQQPDDVPHFQRRVRPSLQLCVFAQFFQFLEALPIRRGGALLLDQVGLLPRQAQPLQPQPRSAHLQPLQLLLALSDLAVTPACAWRAQQLLTYHLPQLR